MIIQFLIRYFYCETPKLIVPAQARVQIRSPHAAGFPPAQGRRNIEASFNCNSLWGT